MTYETKKSIAGSTILVLLGVLALYTGVRFLALLVPVALLVCYGSMRPRLSASTKDVKPIQILRVAE
jgi:hypothetical protein